MGCAVSLRRSGAGDDDGDLWVSVCRERTRLMKSAVDRRYALAGAHFKYNQSLFAVALAIRLFVARHSSAASSPFLITFPEPSPNPTMHLHHTQSKPTPVDTVLVKQVAGDEEEDGTGPICEHFYDDGGFKVVDPTPAKMTSSSSSVTSSSQQSQNEFGGWDFFNPFDNLMVNGKGGCVEEGLKLPAEDHDGGSGGLEIKTAVGDANVSQAAPVVHENDGRELLEALKDVEDHFLKAYESGVEFSKMLEFTNVGPLDHLDFDLIKLKDSQEKFIPSLTWNKSSLNIGSPSCRSLLSSSSRSSSTWTDIDLFNENGGMESGSHLSTLGRLYAWEKKLYNEVKAGYAMKKIYDRKSSQLSNENKGGIEDEVNDLYSKIMVSMKICDSISKRIEQVRDEELQPQLIELLHGLMKTWKVTLESHKAQSRSMFEVKSFVCRGLTNDASHHLATLQLEAEVQNWHTSFSNYISTTKSYIEALSKWAYRAIAPYNESDSPPQVLVFSRDWLAVAKSLPDKAVIYAMKRFAKDIRTLWAQQGIEQQQKRKVDRLVSELEKKVAGLERDERRILEPKALKKHTDENVRHLGEKKAILESLRNIVEIEKAKHEDCVQETRRIILVGFQTGFSSVFDSLTEFFEVCLRKYHGVVENAKLSRIGHDGKLSALSPNNVDAGYRKLS